MKFGTPFGGNGTDFGPGDLIFIIPRSALNPLSHRAFEGLEESGSSASFILAPQSAWQDASISDLYDPANNPTGLSVELSYTFDNVFGPTVTWVQQEQPPGTAISSYSGTFLNTAIFYFAFQMNAGPGANVISASLTGTVGEQNITLWSNVFQPATQINAAAQFTLPQTGTWNLALNVLCDDGSQVVAPLTLSGNSVTIQVDVSGTSYAPSPVIHSKSTVGKYITNLKFSAPGSGVTVVYQLQNRGTAYNPSGWTAAGSLGGGLFGPVPNFVKGTKTLFAKASQTGNTDSAVVSWNL